MSIDQWKTLNCSEKCPTAIEPTDVFIDCLCDSRFLCHPSIPYPCVHRTVVVVVGAIRVLNPPLPFDVSDGAK